MGLKINMAGYDAGVKRLVDSLKGRITKELVSVMRERLIPVVTNNLMFVYDEQIASKAPDYDPAKPASPEIRGAFQESVVRSLTETLASNENTVSISAGNMDELGYGNHTLSYLKSGVHTNPGPLSWLIFYLEGFIGEYYFITESDYKAFHAAGMVSESALEKFSSWGWYGSGFLISKKVYEGQGLNEVSEVTPKLHPLSGLHPSNLFEHALDGIDIDIYIDEAISRALGSQQ